MDAQKITSPKNLEPIKSPTSPTILKSTLNANTNNNSETPIPEQNSQKKSSNDNILSFLKEEKSNSPHDRALINKHKESSEKDQSFEREEDSATLSPTKKSILKRGSKEIDMSPTLKKKGVAFSVNPTEEIAPIEENEEKLDDLFSMIRGRSKSNDADRNYGPSAYGQGNIETVKNSITRNVSVGKVQDGVAILLSEDFNIMEVPLSMLPPDVRKGNILRFTIERNIVEEEGRKDGIVRAQRELLGDKQLFDEYNKKLEHFKNKKMEVLQANNKKNLDLQKIIDDVHINLDASFLDRSGFIDDDRLIVRPKNIIEAKLEKQDSLNKSIGARK